MLRTVRTFRLLMTLWAWRPPEGMTFVIGLCPGRLSVKVGFARCCIEAGADISIDMPRRAVRPVLDMIATRLAAAYAEKHADGTSGHVLDLNTIGKDS